MRPVAFAGYLPTGQIVVLPELYITLWYMRAKTGISFFGNDMCMLCELEKADEWYYIYCIVFHQGLLNNKYVEQSIHLWLLWSWKCGRRRGNWSNVL